jgi:DNA-binding XRE family transcriptional regulator
VAPEGSGTLAQEYLAQEYVEALAGRDLERLLSLFAPDAVVVSPLYGTLHAADFYPRLLADSGASRLTLLGTLNGTTVDGRPLVGIWFRFEWVLATGREAPFDVVDIAELDGEGRVERLRIMYDTAGVRPAFEQETGPSGLPVATMLHKLAVMAANSPPPSVQVRREALAHAVRARRAALGLTQGQVARRVGCDRQTINRVEHALVSPSLDRWLLIADALEVPLAELIAAANLPKPPRLPEVPESLEPPG